MATMMTRAEADRIMRPMRFAADVVATFAIPAALIPDYIGAREQLDVARALVHADTLRLAVRADATRLGFYVQSQTDSALWHHVTLDDDARWSCDCKAMHYARVARLNGQEPRVTTCVHAQTIRLRAYRSHGTRAYRPVANAYRVGTMRLAKHTA